MTDSPNPYQAPSVADAAPQVTEAEPAEHLRPALRRVATGLSLIYYGFLIVILMLISNVAMMFWRGPADHPVPALIFGLCSWVGLMMIFVGPLFWFPAVVRLSDDP